MEYNDFLANWDALSDLIHQPLTEDDEQIAMLKKRYIEQNIAILNELFESSIQNLQRLQKARTANDVICTQARLTNDMSKKLTMTAQQFLNTSLGHIADYNEWLKAHCDLSTD